MAGDGTETPLWDAVEQACVTEATQFDDVEQQMMLSHAIVLAARSGVNDQGESVTQVHVMPLGGAAYAMLGLLAEAKIKLEADMLGGYRDKL